MRRLRLVAGAVLVLAAACGGDDTEDRGASPSGDVTAGFPDPDDLPAISTTTTRRPPTDAVVVEGGGGIRTATTFRGLPADGRGSTTTTALGPTTTVFTSGTRLAAALRGAEAVPPPGDPRGSGSAVLTLSRNHVCFELTARGLLSEPTGAHVHRGVAGAAGDVVIALVAPENDGTTTGCVDAEQAIVEQLAATPSSFYVDFHTGTNPDGAARGQLSKAS